MPVCIPSAAVLVKLVVKGIVHPRVVRHSFILSVSFVWSFFIDRPFGYRQFFTRRRGSQVRGHKPRNWSGILREYPFWRQNAEGCPQNSRPIATAFLGVDPVLPTFVPRISWVPRRARTSKKRKAPHEDQRRTGANGNYKPIQLTYSTSTMHSKTNKLVTLQT